MVIPSTPGLALVARGSEGRDDRLFRKRCTTSQFTTSPGGHLPERFGKRNSVWKRFDRPAKPGSRDCIRSPLAAAKPLRATACGLRQEAHKIRQLNPRELQLLRLDVMYLLAVESPEAFIIKTIRSIGRTTDYIFPCKLPEMLLYINRHYDPKTAVTPFSKLSLDRDACSRTLCTRGHAQRVFPSSRAPSFPLESH
jgi:hypothetical protein